MNRKRVKLRMRDMKRSRVKLHVPRRQKTGSALRHETDTGQTVYARHEPETGQTAPIRHETITGQTANTSASDSSPEEDRRTAQPSLLLQRGLTALPRLRFQLTDDDDARLPGARAVARQTENATPVENAFSMLQLEDCLLYTSPSPRD